MFYKSMLKALLENIGTVVLLRLRIPCSYDRTCETHYTSNILYMTLTCVHFAYLIYFASF